LAVQKNNDNPVYYVQYAHARICSVLASWGGDRAQLANVDLSPLDSAAAQSLMLKLAQYPAMLSAAATDFAPHDVTFYLRELAAAYHSYYDAERILVDDEAVKLARLALVAATAQVLHNGLAVLGVSAPQKM
jgi:arginyl-tRNA synthetase